MGRTDSTGAPEPQGAGLQTALLFGLLATGSIALTAWTAGAGASEPPVHQRTAETTDKTERVDQRAQAARTTLEQLDKSVAADSSNDEPSSVSGNSDTNSEAAPTLSAAVSDLRPPELSPLPDDWSKAGLNPADATETNDGKLVQTLSNGLRVTFTIDPAVQSHMESILHEYNVPHGSVVLLEPSTGRVLAMVDESTDAPKMPALARQATAPSASVFKIITTAALLQEEQLSPQATTCYSGGYSFLSKRNITGQGSKCDDLSSAMANSINSIVAKRAYRHLSPKQLEDWAERFAFNTDIPFELSVEQSSADIPGKKLEMARAAAGFWHTYLSPLHGAMIGAAIQNDGVMMKPSLIEQVETPTGRVLTEFQPEVFRRVVSAETAGHMSQMMQGTTTSGTADDYFARRPAFPNDVTTGGKTGTLADDNPYLSYTWFVGFAQHNTIASREAAVGGLICNTPKWRIKGPWAASETLRKYFQVREHRASLESKDGQKVAQRN
jgi:membrane carboxypeptidase/penicillin-binding protein